MGHDEAITTGGKISRGTVQVDLPILTNEAGQVGYDLMPGVCSDRMDEHKSYNNPPFTADYDRGFLCGWAQALKYLLETAKDR